MARSVRTNLCRVFAVMLAVGASNCWGVQVCLAAGCHVPDRPILQSRFAWDYDQAPGLNPWTVAVAPPVLTHLPCQGEIPHVLDSFSFTVDAACLERTGADSPGQSDPLAMHSPGAHRQPPPLRLDRPPRPVEICVMIEWLA